MLRRRFEVSAIENDALIAAMSGKMYNVRPDIVQPVEQILKRRSGALFDINEVTILRSAKSPLHLAHFRIRAQVHRRICRKVENPELLGLGRTDMDVMNLRRRQARNVARMILFHLSPLGRFPFCRLTISFFSRFKAALLVGDLARIVGDLFANICCFFAGGHRLLPIAFRSTQVGIRA
ncbi:hypothetical protein NX02_16815 [Sphingomonas sanxanigenens DSM 19645 = NX02]|uniref:Uncharacterized protein n=1 Tax=Sphingomonas sanxanigenens DSM 19645 = NX02 TaxID=1123269 RepID=W0AD89_9SPHN|nr:hypothetical protein NX02_16815 [Sphingomonas sanxanigenens DSM 19645 = NX02]